MAMSAEKAQQVLDAVISQGFDRSAIFGPQWGNVGVTVKCSQCQAATINGIACHETGCPNIVHECKGCNARVARAGMYCGDCQ